MMHVMIGSTVRQEHRILECFLDSLRDLRSDDFQVDYLFVDDNDDPACSDLLRAFRPRESRVNIVSKGERAVPYVKDQVTHRWNDSLIHRVAQNKNHIIRCCREEAYDYLLMVDSDLLLHPETLRRLVATGKDIISEIFWTQFYAHARELPNVWLMDEYRLYTAAREEALTAMQIQNRADQFLRMLRRPGVYKVGGLGACTLFSARSLASGVNYDDIYNLSFNGEDRHLCIRATALGWELYVDTCYPCYHLYRPRDLEGVRCYLQSLRSTQLEGSVHLIKSLLHRVVEQRITRDFRCPDMERSCPGEFTADGWTAFKEWLGVETQDKVKTIQKAEVSSVKNYDFTENLEACKVEADITVRGSRQGEPFQISLDLELDCTYDGDWQVAGINSAEIRCSDRQPLYRILAYNDINRRVKASPPRLSLGMLVHNEEQRYLERVLTHAAQYVDEAVIIDDASTDNTVQLCRQILVDIPLRIYGNEKAGFHNEILLRKQLWNCLVKDNPDWILILDADELFEERAVKTIPELIRDDSVDYYAFRIYDFWDEKHYREDSLWCAHLSYRPLLVRYQPGFQYRWRETALHCGRFPFNLADLPGANSDLRLMHLGWSCPEDREKKYERYMQLDADGRYGVLKQYQSILDPFPRLKEWK